MEQALIILLVEDETTYAQLLELFLLDYGHQIHKAHNLADAQKLLENKFDLLITDMNLPDGDGNQLVQLAREKWPDLAVIFMTGYMNNVKISNKIDQENKTLFFKKPFSLKQLLEGISLITQQPHCE